MVGSSSSPASRRRFVAALAFALLLPSSLPVLAELAPTVIQRDRRTVTRDRQVAVAVRSYLKNMHLSRRRLDDEISQRAFDSFIKQLDPMKVYFYQSDVDEFARNATMLDDQVLKGDLSFAYVVFNRFLQRLDERVALIPSLLEMEHDFTNDEQLVRDPDVAVHPKTPEEAADRWRKRIKYDLLLLKDEEVEAEEATDRLTRRYRSFSKRMKQYKPDDLLEMYLSSVTSSYDPHTTYMSPTTLENFDIQMKLNLEGIGAALSLQDGYTVVSRVIPGGAADKQGELKPEDRITNVGQGGDDTGEVVDVVDMRLNDVVQLIRGKKGTIVRLGVITSDGESKTVKIVRDRIELKDSEARGEVISSTDFGSLKKANGAPYQIGVIKLPSFYMDMKAARSGRRDFKSTTRDVRRILADFKSKGIDAVVLDLRFNGGGSLTEAINLTGLFIDTGPVVQVKDSRNVITKYDDVEPGTSWDGPLAVITNKFSASASEILAGAVQDYKRGILIGDTTTHGKGTVQSLMDISEKLFEGLPQRNIEKYGAIKITMQQFYRPNGDSTQRRGVIADIPLPSTTNEMDIGEADLDYAVKFDTVPMAEHQLYNLVRPDLLNSLRTNVKQRIDSSEDFAKEIQRIERYKEQKARDYVSLNEEEFFARRKELNAEKEDEEKFKEIDSGDEKVMDLEDFYDREIMNITLDYVGMLNGVSVAADR